MELVRGGMKNPLTTEWVTSAAMGGTGTAENASDTMVLNMDDLPSICRIGIEVEFNINKIAGTGFPQAVPQVSSIYLDALNTTRIYSNPGYRAWIAVYGGATGTTKKRRFYYFPPVMQTIPNSTLGEYIETRVYAKGTAADTQWTITGIQSRLIYIPL